MRDSLRLYLRYLAISLRSQMQYRASFIMLAVGTFVLTGVEFLAIWVLFERFGTLRGWTLPEVALFYGLVNLSFAVAEAAARGFDTFADLVRTGDFDRLLLRPRNTVLQVAGREFQLMRIGRFAQGLLVLTYAAAILDVIWTLPRILLLIGTVIGGAAVFSGLFVLQATLAFWTIDSLEIMNTMTYGGVQTAQYPISIYRDWFRRFFTYVVPLAAVTYYPAVAILDRQDPLGSTRLVQAISPLVGIVFLAAALQVWKIGVRQYHSTGS